MSDALIWEKIGAINLDSATVGFGDARLLVAVRAQPGLLRDQAPGQPFVQVHDWHAAGMQFIAVETGADAKYPIERGLDEHGKVRALRVEFISDIGDVEGRWQKVGVLSIKTGRCIVADPYCMHSSLRSYSVELGAPDGEHAVEVFFSPGDVLGIRLLFEGYLERPQWGVD